MTNNFKLSLKFDDDGSDLLTLCAVHPGVPPPRVMHFAVRWMPAVWFSLISLLAEALSSAAPLFIKRTQSIRKTLLEVPQHQSETHLSRLKRTVREQCTHRGGGLRSG